MAIAWALTDLGAKVHVADPHVQTEHVPFVMVEPTAAEVAAADAVVLVTDHDAFDYAVVCEHARFVLDTRNRLSGPNVELL
jgi:UDP-N-acetyl-D-glucosamine dehydrogenase